MHTASHKPKLNAENVARYYFMNNNWFERRVVDDGAVDERAGLRVECQVLRGRRTGFMLYFCCGTRVYGRMDAGF